MDERDLETEHPLPRRLVDQLRARAREIGQRGPDVGDLVCDVMHARAAACQEAPDRRVLAERAEQLHTAVPDPDRRRLDALLLDPRPVLERRPEQPLVRDQRTVQIVDGDAHMVNPARFGHAAIVFERLAPTMRTRAPVLFLALVLLAGCGGSGGGGEAAKPATQVLADASEAAGSARTVHVTGQINEGGEHIGIDLNLAKGKGATGSMTLDGKSFDFIRLGDTVYIRGSKAFLKLYAGPAGSVLEGKWLKTSATQGQLREFEPLTDTTALFGLLRRSHGKLKVDGVTSYAGTQAIELVDTSDHSKLYVAATGTPYPVAITGPTKAAGAIKFGDWNEKVSITAPKGAIDLAKIATQ